MTLEAARRPPQPMRTVILVSKEGHCLNDLLFRWKSGLLPLDIARHHLQPPRLLPAGGQLQRAVPPHPGDGGDQGRRPRPSSYEIIEAEGAELVVLARYMQILSRRPVPQAGRPRHQHPPLVPAQLQGRQALLPGARPRREADRRHRALRDGRPRRRPDHRAGRGARRPQRHGGRPDRAWAATPKARCWRAPCKWHSEHRVLLNGHKTVIFK